MVEGQDRRDEGQAGPQPAAVVLRGGDGGPREAVEQPAKLLRIASMVREMLAEVRRAPLDEEGRRHLREIHDRSFRELKEVLSPELCEELESITIPFDDDVPTESQLRVAQAQLTGWLEGLFHGIQAAFFAQQMQAQGQLGELRRHALGSGQGPPGEQAPAGPGQYL